MTEAQQTALRSEDRTIAYVAAALEYAPPVRSTRQELRGFRVHGPRGHFICADCSMRMSARGCMLPSNVSAVWDTDAAPTTPCIGTPFHISTSESTSAEAPGLKAP